MSKSNVGAFSLSKSAGYGYNEVDNSEVEEKLKKQFEAAKKANSQTQWSVAGSNFAGCRSTSGTLPAGVYRIFKTMSGLGIAKIDIVSDKLIKFDSGVEHDVLNKIDHFWKSGERFKRKHVLHRRGFMFYGPPGSGKTSLVNQIIGNLVARNGVVFMCNTSPELVNEALQTFREIEPDRFAICLFEDIDAIINTYGEDELLSLLDGENSIDKVLNIATTNFPKTISSRILRRRRFDRAIHIGTPSDKMRESYFREKLDYKSAATLKNIVKKTKGFNFADCADLVISVDCLGEDVDETLATLRQLSDTANLIDVENDPTNRKAKKR